MEPKDDEDTQFRSYPEDLEEIISMLTHVQSILSQLKSENDNKNIYKLDSNRLRKDNEILKNGLSVLKKVMKVTLQV